MAGIPTGKDGSGQLTGVETIPCPWCWPDDCGVLDYDEQMFACTHCGTLHNFEDFVSALRQIEKDHRDRAQEDRKLRRRITEFLRLHVQFVYAKVSVDEKKEIETAAAGSSISSWVREAVAEKLERDKE